MQTSHATPAMIRSGVVTAAAAAATAAAISGLADAGLAMPPSPRAIVTNEDKYDFESHVQQIQKIMLSFEIEFIHVQVGVGGKRRRFIYLGLVKV